MVMTQSDPRSSFPLVREMGGCKGAVIKGRCESRGLFSPELLIDRREFSKLSFYNTRGCVEGDVSAAGDRVLNSADGWSCPCWARGACI